MPKRRKVYRTLQKDVGYRIWSFSGRGLYDIIIIIEIVLESHKHMHTM